MLGCAEEQQRPHPDRMLDVDEYRSRGAATADLFHHAAIGLLRETAPADVPGRGHSVHAEARKTVDHFAWDVRLPVNRRRIQALVEKRPQPRERVIQLGLLRRPNRGIGHHPVGDEPAEEKSFGDTEFLRAGEEQFLRGAHLFLALSF